MEWPIFYRDNLIIGNSESSVGICTLWTRKEIINQKLPDDKYCVCGNLYTIQGINPMIKNILAKPQIRYIVLCGADLMKSGEALLNLMEKGMDKDRRIAGSSGYIDTNIPEELIEKFQKHVEVIDMRNKEEEVPKKVKELENREPFMKPVFITEVESKTAVIRTEAVAFKAEGKNISETWLKLLDIVMKFGEEKQSDYKVKQKEILDMVAVIKGDDEKLAPWLNITQKDIETYQEKFFSPDKPYGVDYTYGERLFRYALSHVPEKFLGEVVETKNQIDTIVKMLKERPFTRRAVAFTLRETDPGSEHPPCLTQIAFNIKSNRLVQTAVIRSHDIFGAWLLNVFALRKLQKDIAKKLGIEAGSLVTVSNSAHIYENNWKGAKNLLDKYYTNKIIPFYEDDNGYFVIKVEDEIIVEHYTKEGLLSGYVFRGKRPQILFRKIINENLISKMDHAAYIGEELAKAEIALKEGKKFEMDMA